MGKTDISLNSTNAVLSEDDISNVFFNYIFLYIVKSIAHIELLSHWEQEYFGGAINQDIDIVYLKQN